MSNIFTRYIWKPGGDWSDVSPLHILKREKEGRQGDICHALHLKEARSGEALHDSN